jgi:hypothetical protein
VSSLLVQMITEWHNGAVRRNCVPSTTPAAEKFASGSSDQFLWKDLDS